MELTNELFALEIIAEQPMSRKAYRLHREIIAEVEADLIDLVAA